MAEAEDSGNLLERVAAILDGKKTYLTLAVLAVYGIVEWAGVELPEELLIVIAAAAGVALRKAVEKAEL